MGLPSHLSALDRPLPVPATAIYSRSDGIVPWRESLEPAGPRAESIEIESSHLGLGAHPLALYAIADRLAQPEGAWRPFTPQAPLSLLYPDPNRDGWLECSGARMPEAGSNRCRCRKGRRADPSITTTTTGAADTAR